MGQRFVRALHDPDCQKPKAEAETLSEEETDLLFESLIAELDAQERAAGKQD